VHITKIVGNTTHYVSNELLYRKKLIFYAGSTVKKCLVLPVVEDRSSMEQSKLVSILTILNVFIAMDKLKILLGLFSLIFFRV